MLKTEGIVLRELKYQETSKILSIYTRKLGKISVMAKGANRPKSALIANTQPFSHNEYLFSQGRSFYYINQADIINSFYDIRENMERVIYGFYILELIEKSMPDEEANEKIFFLLVKTLSILSQLQDDYLKLIVAFELKYISFLGYKPYLDSCVVCGNKEALDYKFSNVQGGIICTSCYSKDFSAKLISQDLYIAMGKLLYAKLDDLDTIEVPEDVLCRLHDIIEAYILYNIDRKEFNSLNLFKSNKLNLD